MDAYGKVYIIVVFFESRGGQFLWKEMDEYSDSNLLLSSF